MRILLAAALGVVVAAGYLMYDRRAPTFADPPPEHGAEPASGAAAAQKLHKCVDAAGAASIQSAPCPPGSRTLWTRDVTPEPGSEPSLVIGQPEPEADAATPPVSFACQMARADRKAYLAGEAGPITGEESALREQTVREACR